MKNKTFHSIAARYAAFALSAVTALSLCACGSEEQESIIMPEPVTTTARTTVQTTAAAPATTAATTTTAAKPTNFGITIEDVLALDVNELCPEPQKRSGVCVLTERYGETSSYITTRYEFSIDDDLQTGWCFGSSVDEEGQVVAEDFDFEKSIYCIEGEAQYAAYDRETKKWSPLEEPEKVCGAYDHFAAYCYAVVPVQLSCDVFKESAAERNKSIFDDCTIVDVKKENGRKIVCLTDENNMENENIGRRYYWEIDAKTGLCLVRNVYDVHDTLLRSAVFENIKFGDEAVPPLTQQEVRDFILDNGYKTDMLGNPSYPLILDKEITLMPDVYKEVVGEEMYNKIMEEAQNEQGTEN